MFNMINISLGLLKGGFDPNQQYEYIDVSSYDNGAIIDTYVVRGCIMDVVKDETMTKLLRAFGAKSSQDLLAEEMAAKRAAEAAEKERRMKIVDELLAQ